MTDLYEPDRKTSVDIALSLEWREQGKINHWALAVEIYNAVQAARADERNKIDNQAGYHLGQGGEAGVASE